jgi:hypothetical protein
VEIKRNTIMKESDLTTERITVDLGDGVIAQMEVASTGREKVKAGALPFEAVSNAIAKMAQIVAVPIQAVKPTKATVKYGVEVAIEQGSLVAAFVRGTGKANLEITLEWENKGSVSSDDRKLPPSN